jgi:hypothetical protein
MKCPTRAWERLPVYWVKNLMRFQMNKNRYFHFFFFFFFFKAP